MLGAIALVGGTISSYYYLVIFAMSGYTSFKYENELAAKLYTTILKPKSNGNAASENTDGDEQEGRGTKTASVALKEDRIDMTSAILNRRTLPRYRYLSYLYDKLISSLLCCACCRTAACFRESRFRRRRNSKIKDKLTDELDLVSVIQQLRILQFITTTLLRRN